MAYTNPWSDTDPPGSQNANTIDDELRQLRLDIHERMNDIVDDWEDDPVVLAAGGAGGSLGECLFYSDAQSAGLKFNAEDEVVRWLGIRYSGTTNSIGAVTINFNEFAPEHPWLVSDICFGSSVIAYIFHLLRGIRASDALPLFGYIAAYDAGANTIQIAVQHYTGRQVKDTEVYLYILLPMKVVDAEP